MPTSLILINIGKVFDVTPEAMTRNQRHRPLAEARLTAAYYLFTETLMDRAGIARLFGKSLNWVSWCLARCPALAAIDKRYQAKVAAVFAGLTVLKGRTA